MSGRLMLIDRGFESLIETLTYFGFKMPLDYECEALGSIEPFKSINERQQEEDADADAPTGLYDGTFEVAGKSVGEYWFGWDADTEDIFNLWFPEREDAVLKMVSYYEDCTGCDADPPFAPVVW